MKAADPLPRLPYVLLAAMTVVSFGGPFVIVGVIWGGDSARLASRPAHRMGDHRFGAGVVSGPVRRLRQHPPLVPAETKMIRSRSCPERDDDVER